MLSLSCHDAPHLVVDPLLLIRVFNKSPVQGVDSDDLEPLEKHLEVDLVVPSLEEVVLVRVVVLDGDEPSGRLLAKEGASMGNNPVAILNLSAKNHDLSVGVRNLQIVFHKSFESRIAFLAFVLLYLNN